MARKKSDDPVGYGRLLDAWIPPAKAGDALGCFATTFTFHASFFETECLGRMLQLECDPATSGSAYLIEREEKMARLKSACVLVDRNHAQGQRSLRWDLIPFRTKEGILHSKLSILLWQNHARIIVASANLTENGYRQNLEVFTVWDFHEGGNFPAELFNEAANYASALLSHCKRRNASPSPALERSTAFVASAMQRVSAWIPEGTPTPRLRSSLVALTPQSESVFDQLTNLWPGGSRPESLHVLSPFFDESATNTPAVAAWTMLRQRRRARLLFSVIAEPADASGQLLVHAPESLKNSFPEHGAIAQIHFKQIKPLGPRSLHAKALWLENSDHFLHFIGSSNFTSAGLGLGRVRNWELNVASWSRRDNRDEYTRHCAAWPECENGQLDPENVSWMPQPNLEDEGDQEILSLPDWCGSAVFFTQKHGQAALELNINGQPPPEWTILDETGTRSLLSAETWRAGSSPARTIIQWPDPRPPTELLVRVPEQRNEARWPVEVRSFTDLPPPLELRDLTLAQLLEILTSALPLHRCLQKMWRQDSDEPAPSVPMIALDPLQRFSRDTHLLERTRRFSLAMTGMKQRLECPIPSAEYLEWRLSGPVGAAKVAAAILKEAGSNGEKAFLLGELALELSRVQPRAEPGCLSRKAIKAAIRILITDFERQAKPYLAGTETTMKAYVRSALRKALS